MKNYLDQTPPIILFALLLLSCRKTEIMKQHPGEKAIISTTALPLIVPVPPLIYEETMEGPTPFSTANTMEIGSWDYALQYVTSPVFQGNKSARFEIRKDQPLIENGKRAEVDIVKGVDGDITRDTWYSFSAYFPTEGYEYDIDREVINQWYQNGSPATSLRTQKDRFLFESGDTLTNREQYDLGPIVKDTWQEFVFHFIHSHDSDGLIEVWHNGEKILTRTGGNMYEGVLPTWKIGLYKAAFKTNTSLVTRRIIYFDNIRVGNSNATYADMTSFQK